MSGAATVERLLADAFTADPRSVFLASIAAANELIRERDDALARVAEVEAQRNSAFDTANTARALLSRVEELEGLLRTWAVASWTTPGPEEGRAWLALYSEAMRLADVECESYCRARAQVPV